MSVSVSAFSLLCVRNCSIHEIKKAQSTKQWYWAFAQKAQEHFNQEQLIGDVQASATASASAADKRPRLWRRNSDETASRCVKLKLGMFSSSQVANNVDSSGDSVHACVKKELRRLKSSRKHISIQFWSNIVKSHHLCGTLADGLAEPAEEERISKELDQALRMAHLSNPATRSATRLCRFLEYSGPLNRTETYGLLAGAVESPSLSASMSRTIMESLLRYWARVGAHQLHPDYHEVFKNRYDEMLATAFQRAQSSGLSRAGFLRAWRQPLALFIDMSAATDIEKRIEMKETLDPKVIEDMMKGSLVGSELFAEERQACELSHFVGEITQRITELELQHFGEEDVLQFKQICAHQAESLDSDLWDAVDGRELSLNFLSGIVPLTLNPNDEWAYPFQARLKTIAVSRCLVPRFPWEIALFGEQSPIPGVPETVQVPESLIFDIGNGRVFVLGLLDGWQTIDSWKRCIKANIVEIRKADRTFWLDEEFLNSSYDALADKHFKMCLMECIPKPGERRNIAKALVAARALVTSAIVTAQDRTLERELLSVTNLLADIANGQGCEHVCHVFAEIEGQKNAGRMTNMLHGCDAIGWRVRSCEIQVGIKGPPDLKELKCFRWMLSLFIWGICPHHRQYRNCH